MLQRSLLFVPGDRPERFDKARRSGAHAVILDLEDAVAPAQKEVARAHVDAWLKSGLPAMVRVNAVDTKWAEEDLRMTRTHANALIMLPKAEPTAIVHAQACSGGGAPAIVALVETVRGVLSLHEMACLPGVKRLSFGSVDFCLESGIENARDTLVAIRTRIVLASCAAKLEAPIDGVSLDVNDMTLAYADAMAARRAGFGGKLCIHPKQIASVNGAFAPTPDELEWARAVIAASEKAPNGAISLQGKMIDRPLIEAARRLISATGNF